MKEKIASLLGAAVTDRVEKKAAARGIADIWKRAEDRANAELPGADEPALVSRAAIRACQIAGIVSRIQVPPTAPAAAPEAPANSQRPRRSAPAGAQEPAPAAPLKTEN